MENWLNDHSQSRATACCCLPSSIESKAFRFDFSNRRSPESFIDLLPYLTHGHVEHFRRNKLEIDPINFPFDDSSNEAKY